MVRFFVPLAPFPDNANRFPEAKQPAFLQRLKNQYGDTSGRLERPIARPRKPKNETDDDGPTYVDEESNEIISKEEYEALVRGDEDREGYNDNAPKDPEDKGASGSGMGVDGTASKQNVAEIGGPRKRKQAKVVGEEPRAEETKETPRKDSGSRKAKQKKKIKLSFDDES
ncbi:hypothetical protein BO70DRAFT_366693 [Aspergillus heteromorphus CBS 117.55]|uniref:DUF4604 domain-containing protein n=1 Tax=Aspergillus heteromorphus CBS 117.55 TaxID=1448321 RepID=A0A317UVU3_9EURO|nr:uncharacterized protein BO70DRAFT_366693 [Aspergillus heteromorphus CBS 117.55]PWY65566.1 hypothetical protein BO70DRAFT_366693 [Aspergillus heteromorphus CBS 117.55]